MTRGWSARRGAQWAAVSPVVAQQVFVGEGLAVGRKAQVLAPGVQAHQAHAAQEGQEHRLGALGVQRVQGLQEGQERLHGERLALALQQVLHEEQPVLGRRHVPQAQIVLQQDGEGPFGHPPGRVGEHGGQQGVHPALPVPQQAQAVEQREDQRGVPLLADEGVLLQQLAQLLLGRQPALQHPDPAHAAQQHRRERQGEAVRLGRDQRDAGLGLERERPVVEVGQGVRHPARDPPRRAVRKDQPQPGQLVLHLLGGLQVLLGQRLQGAQLAAVQVQQGVGEMLVVLEMEHHRLQQAHAPFRALLPVLGKRKLAPRADLAQLLVGAISQ